MTPLKFDEQSRVLGAGDNPNTADLPITITTSEATPGPVYVTSCWKPSKEELESIISCGCVWVHIMAHPDRPTQPPIYISGFHPSFDGYEFKEAPIEKE